MKKRKVALTLAFTLLFCISVFSDEKSDLEILQAAYPGAFEIVPNGIRFLTPAGNFPAGTVIVYNDGENKNFDALLERPDLKDMLSLSYPLGEQKNLPPENFDPGRFRPDAFFRALYGRNEAEIRAQLRSIQWMPSLNGPQVLVTTRFGVDKKLEAVIADLEALGPQFARYLVPPGGTFNYRAIAGTDRLSAHSFGIAIDIAVNTSHYWLWETKRASEYKNSIPYEIVAIFEKHGFIWGGKWYHFDTMHFEYRPELLAKAGQEQN